MSFHTELDPSVIVGLERDIPNISMCRVSRQPGCSPANWQVANLFQAGRGRLGWGGELDVVDDGSVRSKEKTSHDACVQSRTLCETLYLTGRWAPGRIRARLHLKELE